MIYTSLIFSSLILFIFLVTGCATTSRNKTSSVLIHSHRRPKLISYRIKKGDTLWRISKKFHTSVENILKENKQLSPSHLKPGETIKIPRENITKPYFSQNSIKFSWPIKGKVINGFGENQYNNSNCGIDIKPYNTIFVKSSAPGKVIFADFLKNWGGTVILKHKHKFYTVYSYLKNIKVKEDTLVRRGQIIGAIGTTSQLHFEIRKSHLPLNPIFYLN